MAGDLLHPYAAAFSSGLDRSDVVVLIHGWTGSPSHFRPISQRLDSAGLGFVAPRLAGHGTRVEDMLDTGWRDWVGSAAAAAMEAGAAGGRVHVVGLSMGALIGLLLSDSFAAASVTTINAPVFVFNRRIRIAFLLRGSDRIEPDEDEPWPDGFAVEYAHQYDETPVGTTADLYDIMRAAKRHLPLVSAPALVIQSRTDETVRAKSGEYIYDHLGSITKKMLWLQRSRHVATLDTERELIADEIIAHVAAAARIGGGHDD